MHDQDCRAPLVAEPVHRPDESAHVLAAVLVPAGHAAGQGVYHEQGRVEARAVEDRLGDLLGVGDHFRNVPLVA